jgi:hypothetical protein
MDMSYFYDIGLGVHAKGHSGVTLVIPDFGDGFPTRKRIGYNDLVGDGKTFGQAENFENLGEISDNRDAHTAMLIGSEEFHMYAIKEMWKKMQYGVMVTNMDMTTDNMTTDQSGDPINVQGFLYRTAQQQFTGLVQSGTGNITGYGKEFGSKRAIASVFTTGEDSFAVFVQQYYHNQGRQYSSLHRFIRYMRDRYAFTQSDDYTLGMLPGEPIEHYNERIENQIQIFSCMDHEKSGPRDEHSTRMKVAWGARIRKSAPRNCATVKTSRAMVWK